MAQYDLHRREEFCLVFAREVVAAKIESSAALLRRYRRNHPEAVPLEEIAILDQHAAAAAEAPSLDSLRGIEGTAAARYFCLLSPDTAECLARAREGRGTIPGHGAFSTRRPIIGRGHGKGGELLEECSW